MNNYIIYLTESAISIALFYIVYWFFLRNKTTYKLCRIYLLSMVFASILIPLNKFSLSRILSPDESKNVVVGISNTKNNYERFLASKNQGLLFQDKNKTDKTDKSGQEKHNTGLSEKNSGSSFFTQLNYSMWLLIIYVDGVVLGLIFLLIQISQVLLLIRKNELKKEGNIKYVFLNKDISPFSFFNYIFLNKSGYSSYDKQKIIEHEKIHVSQRHSFDILLFELLTIIQWFNPFVWFMKKSLKMTHEYLADKGVIQHGYDIKAYQSLLLEQLVYPASFRMVNTFNFKPIIKRLAMMTKIQLNKNKKLRLPELLPVISITLLAALIAIIISCTNNSTNDYNIINITGEGKFYNYSKSCYGYMLYADSANNTSMLAKKGDLIIINDFPYYYNDQTKTTFNIISNDSLLYINGKIASAIISAKYDLLPVLEQMNSEDISALKSLQFKKDIPVEYIPYIEKIALQNPEIGLFFDNMNNETRSIIKKFNPDWIVFDDISTNDFDVFSGCTNAELIFLSISDSIISKPLPKMKKLKHLILSDLKSKISINDNFLSNNQQIESIIFVDSYKSDFNFINSLTRLKELIIAGDNNNIDIGFIKQFKNLEVLSLIFGDSVENILAINEILSLKWLIVSDIISQSDFNSIINNHDKLEIVELIACENIIDLNSLKKLNDLEGLVITETLNDSSALPLLTNLKYLSLPDKVMEDSTYLASLQNSLSGCTIVPNGGFCLGSGWLFLIFPLILLFRIWRKKSSGLKDEHE